MTIIDGLIQARMGSRRLPGKAMMPLAGRPIIWHIFNRLSRGTTRAKTILFSDRCVLRLPSAMSARR